MEISITNFGATVQSIKVPTKEGLLLDVVLGFDTIQEYEAAFAKGSSPYFGAIIGRVAGRIHRGKFTLNSKTYSLDCNLGNDHLHGGKDGFSTAVWTIVSSSDSENPYITLRLLSKGIDCGYPGDVTLHVKYTLFETNAVSIEMTATSTEDTVLNLTQHSYFNLSGHAESLEDHELRIDSSRIIEVNKELIPTSHFNSLKKHAFDFTEFKPCPSKIDTSFILDHRRNTTAELTSTDSNLSLKVKTNQPIMHIYIGGQTEIQGKEGISYHSRSGICFEAQGYPDAPNQPNFPSIALKKGQEYRNETIFEFQHEH